MMGIHLPDSEPALHTFAIVILITLIIALFIVYEIRRDTAKRNRQIAATFSGRPALRPQQFYEQYFQALGITPEVAMGVRRMLEEQLDADLSQLSSADDFSSNLGFFFEYDSMADVEIIIALEKDFAISIADAEAQSCHTIQDLVCLVQRKLQEKTGQGQESPR